MFKTTLIIIRFTKYNKSTIFFSIRILQYKTYKVKKYFILYSDFATYCLFYQYRKIISTQFFNFFLMPNLFRLYAIREFITIVFYIFYARACVCTYYTIGVLSFRVNHFVIFEFY